MEKMNSKIVIAAALLGVALSGCTKLQSANSGSASSLSTVKETPPPVGFLSAEQILKSMISVTGVQGTGQDATPADDLIVSTFNLRSGSLPSQQTLDQATGPMLISVANLASAVCAKAVDNDIASGQAQASTRLFFREMDFSKGLSAQPSTAAISGFDRLARNSWRRDPSSTEESSISSFVTDFSADANGSDVAETRLLAISVCTAVLSSVDALTY